MAISLETQHARPRATSPASSDQSAWIAFLVMMSLIVLGIVTAAWAVMTI